MRKLILMVLLIMLVCFNNVFAASIQLDWNANTESDLIGYKIYQSNTSGVYGTTATATVGTITTWTSGNLVDGTYYFVLTAVDDSGNESEKSVEVSGKIDTVPPGKTLGLTKIIISKNKVQLNWTASTASDTVGYKIYQSTATGSYGTAIATLGKVTTWTSTVLEDGTYYFVVSAIDDSGNEGERASEVSAKIDNTPPAKPTGLRRTIKK